MNKKGGSILILILLITILAISTALYLKTRSTTSLGTVNEDIVEKQTYNDPQGRFSFKYPADYSYKDLGNTVISFIDKNNTTQFNLSRIAVLNLKEYQEYMKDRTNNGGFLSQKEYKDQQGRNWQTDMVLGETFNFTGIVNENEKYYIVSLQSGYGYLNYKDDGDEFRKFSNEILSTFTFK